VAVTVAPPDVAAVLAGADAAVTAGGSTVFQLAALGTPALAVAQYGHQRANIDRAVAAGAAVDLGQREALSADRLAAAIAGLDADPGRRRAMSEAGRRLVDGEGARRVADLIVGRLLEVACRS
jgi:UDP-N-acetylglucosamine:LPS N-acetylglucosamine transferase